MTNNTIVSIYGKKGSGKTVKAVELFNSYKDIRIFWNFQQEEYPILAVPFNDLENWKVKYSSYNFLNDNENLLEQMVDRIKQIQEIRMKKNKNAHILLVIDECDKFANHQMGVNNPNYSAMNWLCRKSRSRNIDLIFITQKPQRLHPDIYSETDIFYFYFLNNKDWKFLKNNAWLDVSDALIEHTHPYKSYKYVEFNDTDPNGIQHEAIQLDKRWSKSLDEGKSRKAKSLKNLLSEE